jgi:GH15 family glucan-1,4-alpha-glucosidase
VLRSAVVLSQLTFKPTGALQAAATTSLPEALGGSRNMDYRFCWVRDSGFALTALTGLRLHPEVHATMSFLLRALRASAPDVPPFYSMYGEPVSPVMQSVSGWTGYRCSSPVQRGNHASDQRQLGSYGDALEAISRYVAHGNKLDGASGRLVAQMAEQVCRQWREPDAGLWELSQTRPYTSSKIGCWAALTRAAELADAGQVPAEGAPRWRLSADQIRRYINQTCWSSGKGSYTFYAGGNELDAATLLVARTGFCSADDPRLHRTIEAIRRELSAGGPLLYRYSGMAEKEGAFLACTFWLVEALVHAGRLDEAGALMDAAVEQANDVGLLSEEIDPASRELLGNMPQALSHLALINAAIRFTAAT